MWYIKGTYHGKSAVICFMPLQKIPVNVRTARAQLNAFPGIFCAHAVLMTQSVLMAASQTEFKKRIKQIVHLFMKYFLISIFKYTFLYSGFLYSPKGYMVLCKANCATFTLDNLDFLFVRLVKGDSRKPIACFRQYPVAFILKLLCNAVW